jgi:8-oxo-dGTP pyrophosphatase MutT (NUDIX family)
MKKIARQKKHPGAGIIVVKKFKDVYRVLGLNIYGKFDIPKGQIDPGETPFEAALRETEEESSINQLQFNWGLDPIEIKHLTIYIAETDQDPVIQRNPITNMYEHHDARWISWEEICDTCIAYLRPAIITAKFRIENL